MRLVKKAFSLEKLSEKSLQNPADPSLIAYSPSMDLIALGTTDQQVFIYRLNGQRVYGAEQKAGSSLRLDQIQWKPNGQLLAIAWSDGSVRLVGAESTKIVHQFMTGDEVEGITCMGWVSNYTRRVSASVGSINGSGSWEDILADDLKTLKGNNNLDLPRDLSLIDIETSLPKLSILASGASPDDVFTSRASLDALFLPFDPKDNDAINVMVVGTKQGLIHITIYDSFVVGSFPSPVTLGGVPGNLVLHASHELYSTHALLLRGSNIAGGLYFVPMDLRFVSTSSDYLSLLASRSTVLQNLLRYIQQVQGLMVSEWQSTQDLPGKFLRNINESLAENGNLDIVTALYHSVATGHTVPPVREWLLDELSERGHKRWDKTVTAGLENLRRLVHENMLPALDRCSVILSRFAGIAKFQGNNETVGFSSQQISLLKDTIACLHLVSSKILLQVVDELDLFAAFSSWLRYEIDRLSSDPSAIPNDPEATDKESSIEHSKVLLYLQTAMTCSPLAQNLAGLSPEEFDRGWNSVEEGVPMFDILDKQMRNNERAAPQTTTLSRVELLCKILTKQTNCVFAQIAEAEKRNVRFGAVSEIGANEKEGPMDMKMSKATTTRCRTHIAFIPKGQKSIIQVTQIEFSIEKGISDKASISSSAIQLADGIVKDIKFSEEHMLVLWESNGDTKLLTIPYQPLQGSPSSESDVFRMQYSIQGQSTRPQNITVLNYEEVITHFSESDISSGGSFVPERIQIRKQIGQSEKEDHGRLVLLGRHSAHYQVLKIRNRVPDIERDNDVDML